MDKRTLYAILISTVIILVGFSLQAILNEQRAQEQLPSESEAPDTETAQEDDSPPEDRAAPAASGDRTRPIRFFDDGESVQCEPYFNNGTVEVSFSTQDGGIRSFKLLNHFEEGRPVELIFKGESERNPFTIIIGDQDGYFLEGNYTCERGASHILFSAPFSAPAIQSEPFIISIKYTFAPDEYFFEQQVEIKNSINAPIPLSADNNTSYTIFVGPQIGPEFEVLDNRSEYRKYITLDGRNRDTTRFNRRRSEASFSGDIEWASIVGKYFTLIALPHAGTGEIIISSDQIEGVMDASSLYLTRLPIQSSVQIDTYRFYFGPKQRQELIKYDQPEDNAFMANELSLRRVQDSRPLIGWLEAVLKWMLTLIYAVIPNYGIAIIILTIIVKVLTHPLTRKSQQSTERMQTLAPQIKELREKYEHDKQRLNVEIAQLYKAEKVNPAGGCLPLLLQMPFFFAMFGIFNNHFELRNAVFIRNWIDDLSMPESIWNFGDFTLPLLGWNDLRLLPILYVVSQFLSGYLSKNPAQTQQQNKMLLIMPLVLFFVLYNLPSGLLVYWIVTNLLMVGQQTISKIKKKASAP